MRLSKLMMPAVLTVGALALAGCGGGSDTPAATPATTGGDGALTDAQLRTACGDLGFTPGSGKCNEPEVTDTEDDQVAYVSARSLRFGIGEVWGSNYVITGADLAKGRVVKRGNQDSDPQGPDGTGTAEPGFENADKDLRVRETLDSPAAEIGTLVTGAAFDADKVAPGVFNVGPSARHAVNGEYDHDADDSNADVPAFSVKTTYDGVPGTLFCTSDPPACASGSSNDRESFVLNGDWGFHPDDPKAKLKPAPYAEFGWWRLDWDEGGDVREVGVFRGQIVTTGNKNILPSSASLGFGGTATYTGDAVGLYSVNVGAGEANDFGGFKATATLEATFGDDPNVSGTVDDFKGSDGQDRDWKIELVKAGLGNTGAISPTGDDADNSVKWTVGGETEDDGRWEAQMYGGGTGPTYPGYALGSFGAEHRDANGRIVGTFGVEHQKPAASAAQ